MAARTRSLVLSALAAAFGPAAAAAIMPLHADRLITANAEGMNPENQAPQVVRQASHGDGFGVWQDSLFSFAAGGHSAGLAESSQESGWLLSSFFAEGRASAGARRLVEFSTASSDAVSSAVLTFDVARTTLIAFRASVVIDLHHEPSEQLAFDADAFVRLSLVDGGVIELVSTAASGPRGTESLDRIIELAPGSYELTAWAAAFHMGDAAATETSTATFSMAMTEIPGPGGGLLLAVGGIAVRRSRLHGLRANR